jgi:hypothetical protein
VAVVSRYRRPSRPASAQAAFAIAALVVVSAVVAWLGHTAPTAELVPVAPDVGPDEFGRHFVDCETALPVAQRFREGDQPPRNVEPVGRVVSGEIVECPRHFDGLPVSYVGEVVGDVLGRRGGAWTLVNDDRYALGPGPLGTTRQTTGTNSGLAVWLPADVLDEELDEITPGRAAVRGDVVRVVGVLHRTDPQDGGGLTIRAVRAELLAPAEEIPEPFDPRRALVGALLLAASAWLTVLERRRRLA